jgi:uncharacterized membrane protein YgcG
MKLLKQSLSVALSCYLVLMTSSAGLAQQAISPATQTPVEVAPQTPQQLQQLVAPIALYPDALVAQILAAATYPDQVVEADRWMEQNPGLQAQQVGEEVDKQPWDPSVKALTEFPSVLANMDKNLSWTSSLGDAYVNQQKDVMDAVQVMRVRAQKVGNLKTTSQETVSDQGQTIEIQPADVQVVYVPEYDPWLVYGEPLAIWPDWFWYPGLYVSGPGLFWGTGIGIGFFGGFDWGWGHWGYDWHRHDVLFDHHGYVSHSTVFANREHFDRASGFHAASGSHPVDARGFVGAQHGFASRDAKTGMHSGAFSGFNRGGSARNFSARGNSSFGGGFHTGGGVHGGGGGGHR